MNNPVLFMKYALFSKRIFHDIRSFFNFTYPEFMYFICAILYTLSDTKEKHFGPEQIAQLFFIFSQRKLKDYRQLKIKLAILEQKGYLNIVFVKKEVYGYATFYTINPDKMNYFLSAFNTFINYELENIKTTDSVDNKAVKKLARRDVLKHIQTLKRLSKNK